MVKIINDSESLRAEVARRKRVGKTVALVPTMGALHEGHLSLMRKAHEVADVVMVSIFVNPTQFGPNEDYDTYPRTFEADIAKLEKEQVDIVYAPDVQEMYPEGAQIDVKAKPSLVTGLCAAFRPGFFDGVATVVARLLRHTEPDIAIFGEKDYQQLQVIRQMVKEENIGVEIIGAPLIREEDGLAMSSRNAYLSEEERELAPKLYEALQQAAVQLEQGQEDALAVAEQAIKEAGFTKFDYLSLVDAQSLQPMVLLDKPARLLVAAWIGKTRLIDNIAVEPVS